MKPNQLPANIDAERALLGCLILENRLIDMALEILPVPAPSPKLRRLEDAPEPPFSDPRHQAVWEAIAGLRSRGVGVDLTTLAATLADQGRLEMVGGSPYLAGLEDDIYALGQAPEYARLIAKKWRLRRLARLGTTLAEHACAGEAAPEAVIEQAERGLVELAMGGSDQKIRHAGEIALDEIQRLETCAAQRGLAGLSTGFAELDQMTSGLKPGQMITVAARPAVGKSAFAGNVAAHVAFNLKLPVAIFSLEMSEGELIQRLLASVAHISMGDLQQPSRLDKRQRNELHLAGGILHESPLMISDKAPLKVTELVSMARRVKSEYPALALIVIDYLQLLEDSGRYAGKKVDEVAEVSKTIKTLAKELKVPIIALSQLSRKIEDRNGSGQGQRAKPKTIDEEMPRLSDIRDSGAVEQDCDIVMMLARKEDRAWLKVAKQRNGPTGIIDLTYFGEYCEFRDAQQ
jgi:replicative DNA helicase